MKLNGREVHEGDILQNLGSGQAFVIIYVDGDRAVGMRAVTVTNPSEWKHVGVLAPVDGTPRTRT